MLMDKLQLSRVYYDTILEGRLPNMVSTLGVRSLKEAQIYRVRCMLQSILPSKYLYRDEPKALSIFVRKTYI
jgi:hypothetical protein